MKSTLPSFNVIGEMLLYIKTLNGLTLYRLAIELIVSPFFIV